MSTRACWCGHAPLEPFSAEYLRCAACDTLVLAHPPDDVASVVDEAGVYGKDYWFAHQAAMGLPDIVSRARLDFGDRLVPWLQSLVRYRVPPARTLELGSSHGGFVALLQASGFDATGLELSPAIAALARELFAVPVLVGPLESQGLAAASVDVAIAMDVLEHLADPLQTLRAVASVLSPSGMVMFQTPAYPEGESFDALQAQAHPFLSMLLPQEHTFLFSRRAMRMMLEQVGLTHVVFETAVFDHYDMLVLASSQPLAPVPVEAQEQALLGTPRGRLVQALVDKATAMRVLESDLAERLAERRAVEETLVGAEADRAARLEVIATQGTALGVAEARASELLSRVHDLEAHLAAAQEDRQARLEVIERQGAALARAEQRAADFEQQAAALQQHLAAAEADRAARLAVIEDQGQRLGVLPGLEAEVTSLRERLAAAEADRAARLAVIEEQGRQIATLLGMEQQLQQVTEERNALRDALDEASRVAARLQQRIAPLEAHLAVFERSRSVRVLRRLGLLAEAPGGPGA